MNFFVPGVPKPQGSKRAFVVKGRPVLVESAGVPLKDWRSMVAHVAAGEMGERLPLEGPLLVTLNFYLPRPKSHPKTKVTYPSTRPDLDKLARACLDALTHICFYDDGQVISLYLNKHWGDKVGVHVEVEQLLGEAA
jgi:crossover junction endodeoxyribonuclease RusA